jgi:uncharacterized phage infection (PIP) family protein YhgE
MVQEDNVQFLTLENQASSLIDELLRLKESTATFSAAHATAIRESDALSAAAAALEEFADSLHETALRLGSVADNLLEIDTALIIQRIDAIVESLDEQEVEFQAHVHQAESDSKHLHQAVHDAVQLIDSVEYKLENHAGSMRVTLGALSRRIDEVHGTVSAQLDGLDAGSKKSMQRLSLEIDDLRTAMVQHKENVLSEMVRNHTFAASSIEALATLAAGQNASISSLSTLAHDMNATIRRQRKEMRLIALVSTSLTVGAVVAFAMLIALDLLA